jgi:hypothetical protein
MKHIKTFELYTTGQVIDYELGDIVVCVNDITNNPSSILTLNKGDKYKVVKIYRLPEDIYLKNDYLRVDIENIETGKISRGWESTRFKAEVENIADTYNL